MESVAVKVSKEVQQQEDKTERTNWKKDKEGLDKLKEIAS